MLAESWKMTATYPVLYGPGQHQLPTFTLQDRRCSGNTQDRAHVGRQPDTSGDIAAATKYLGGNAARPCSTSGYRADDLLEKPVADVCPDCYTHGETTTMRKELLQTGGQPSIIHEPFHVACSARNVSLLHKKPLCSGGGRADDRRWETSPACLLHLR